MGTWRPLLPTAIMLGLLSLLRLIVVKIVKATTRLSSVEHITTNPRRKIVRVMWRFTPLHITTNPIRFWCNVLLQWLGERGEHWKTSPTRNNLHGVAQHIQVMIPSTSMTRPHSILYVVCPSMAMSWRSNVHGDRNLQHDRGGPKKGPPPNKHLLPLNHPLRIQRHSHKLWIEKIVRQWMHG